jgi:hypothetical protein
VNEYDYRRSRRELRELREQVAGHRRTERHNRRRRVKKINELQDDVAFLALMNRALLEVILKAGLSDSDEFAALVEALDAADGVSGDGMDVAELKEEVGVAEEQEDPAERFRKTFGEALERKRRRLKRFD